MDNNDVVTKLGIRLANIEIALADVEVQNDRLKKQVENLQAELAKQSKPEEEQPK